MSEILNWTDLFGTVDTAIAVFIPDASSGDGIIRTDAQCREWAESIGCDVQVAEYNQLFVDIDTEAQFALYKYQILLLKKHFYFTKVDIVPSKQGLPHRHITIHLAQPMPLLARIALQACLGSDPTRELLSVRRALNEEDNVVLFFEKKPQIRMKLVIPE